MNKLNLKPQTKTKNQIHLGIKKNLVYLICIIGSVLIFIAPIIHVKFSTKNPIVESYKKELSTNIESIDDDIENLRVQYYNSNKEYFLKYDQLVEKRKSTQENNNKLITVKTNENRVFYWKTLRSFLIGFGIRLPYLLFAFFISFIISKTKTEDRNLKHCYNLIQVSMYSIALYVNIWCFWPHQDYNITSYLFAALSLCILVSAAAVYFISYKKLLKLRLQKMVDAFSSFIVKDAKKHIKPELKQEYVKDYLEAFKKGLE